MWGIILYICAFAALFSCILPFVCHNRVRNSLIATYLGIGLFVWFTTELLSIFHAIHRPAILIVWSFLILGCGVFFIKRGCLSVWKKYLRHHPLERIGRDIWQHKWIALMLLWIGGFTFLGAILYCANTYDAMTYHMTRIMLWLQNRDVSYVVCNDERLNYQMPLAEYCIMHLQLLLSKDYLANLVQWNAFVSSLITVSLIASELGLNRKAQWITVFIMATIPNVVMQSHSTQNDLVICSYLLIFVLFMLKLKRNITLRRIILAGIAMGLTIMAKGTGFLYIAILGVSFGIWIMIKSGRKWFSAILKCLGIVCIGIAIVVPVFVRNYRYYQTILPSSPQDVSYLLCDWHGKEPMRAFARSMSLHFGLPFNGWNEKVQKGLTRVFGERFEKSKNTRVPVEVVHYLHQDTIGNFGHLLLMGICTLFIGIVYLKRLRNRRKNKDIAFDMVKNGLDCDFGVYTFIAWMVLIVLCTVLCYSPWRARYHVPAFCLFSVSTAGVLLRLLPNRWLRGILFLLLFGCAGWVLHCDPSSPLRYQDFKKINRQTIRQNHQTYVTEAISSELQELKHFLDHKKIREINHHNHMNQRDYVIYRFLGGHLQDDIQIHRIIYEKGKQYQSPYLLISDIDKHNSIFPSCFTMSIPGKVVYASKNFYLFDLSQEKKAVKPPMTFMSSDPRYLYFNDMDIESTNGIFRLMVDLNFAINQHKAKDVYIDMIHDEPKYEVTHYRYTFNGKVLGENKVPKKNGEGRIYSFVIPNEEIQSGEMGTLRIEFLGKGMPRKKQQILRNRENPIYKKIKFYYVERRTED